MGKGPTYTKDELTGLTELLFDNPDKKYIELADAAIRYGIVTNRGREAVADRISRIDKSIRREMLAAAESAQAQMPADELLDLMRQRDYFEEQYTKLRTAIEELYKEINA